MLKKFHLSLKILILICLIASLVTATSAYMICPDTQNSDVRYSRYSDSYLNTSRGQGQSFFVENPGLISEFQMCFSSGIKRNFSTHEIICNLRDSQGKILQNSSIHGFYYFDYGYKTFRFNKNLSKGSYIITCCLNSPNPDENHEYPIKFYYSNNSYIKGSRYISFGDDCNNFNTWKITQGDALFKVIINEEETIKPPNVPEKTSGPSLGLIGIEYSFSTSAIDPNNDKIMYIFDWGDGTSSHSKYYDSSFSASEKHSWSFSGNYSIKVRATNSNGSISSWSEQSRITIKAQDKEEIEEIVEKRFREKILLTFFEGILVFILIIGFLSLLNKVSSKIPKINTEKIQLLTFPLAFASFIGFTVSGIFDSNLWGAISGIICFVISLKIMIHQK